MWKLKTEGASEAMRCAGELLSRCLKEHPAPEDGKQHTLVCRRSDTLPAEGCRIRIAEPDANGEQHILLEGGTEAAALYAAADFTQVLLPKLEQAHVWMNPYYFTNPFETLFAAADMTYAPKIKRRGLWTWGHVIYDYRGYLRHMAQLKLNELVIWNDYVPLNAQELVSFAHELGIRIIWGYSWGWDTKMTVDLSDKNGLRLLADKAVETFCRDYAKLPGDGLYFQSFTETAQEEANGCLIAQVVADWVNGVCSRILAERPELELQFGLHATSVKRHLDCIAKTDPRVRIVWEDCGSFPYAYMPENMEDFSQTLSFTHTLTGLRNPSRTGLVTKGMICLDWTSFVHRTGPERIGEATEQTIAERLIPVSRIMKNVQSFWIKNGDALRQTVLTAAEGDSDCQILALLEDGLFDRRIWLPAALFAATLWNPERPFEQLLEEVSQRPDVWFANLENSRVSARNV